MIDLSLFKPNFQLKYSTMKRWKGQIKKEKIEKKNARQVKSSQGSSIIYKYWKIDTKLHDTFTVEIELESMVVELSDKFGASFAG